MWSPCVFMKLRMTCVPLLLGLTLGTVAMAQSSVVYFRYYDDKHQLHLDQQLSDDALTNGYDELDRSLNLIRTVPPRLTARDIERLEEAKHQQEMAEEQARRDALLRQLYSSPKDAERERDRQLEAIEVRIEFNKSSLTRLRTLRSQEAARAAGFERNGQPVPKDTRDNISRYDQQIISAENDLRDQQSAQDNIRADFEPKIKRLQEMEAARAAEDSQSNAAESAAPVTSP